MKNVENLIREIKTLSSGTILSIARESGLIIKGTWLEAEALEDEWIEYIERTKDTSENWKQSWKKFAEYKDELLEAWLNEESEEKEMKKEIKVDRIMETTYEDGTSWVEYRTPQGYFGYEITEDYEEDDEEELEKEINEDEVTYNGMIDKKHISRCSDYLSGIIEECRQSDNEMWFVEFDELQEELSACTDEVEQFISRVQKEVIDLGIEDYITFYEDGCAITVYGGVITQFLFGGEIPQEKNEDM